MGALAARVGAGRRRAPAEDPAEAQARQEAALAALMAAEARAVREIEAQLRDEFGVDRESILAEAAAAAPTPHATHEEFLRDVARASASAPLTHSPETLDAVADNYWAWAGQEWYELATRIVAAQSPRDAEGLRAVFDAWENQGGSGLERRLRHTAERGRWWKKSHQLPWRVFAHVLQTYSHADPVRTYTVLTWMLERFGPDGVGLGRFGAGRGEDVYARRLVRYGIAHI